MPKITDIELGVKLTPEGVKKSAEELGAKIGEIFNKSSGKALDSNLKNLQTQMSKTSSKANELVADIDKLGSKKIPTPDYTQATKGLEKLEKDYAQFQENSAPKIQVLKDKMDKLAEIKTPTEQYNNLSATIDRLDGQLQKLGEESIKLQSGPQTAKATARLEAIEIEAEKLQTKLVNAEDLMRDLEDKGKAFTLGSDTGEYKQLQSQLDTYTQKGKEFERSIADAKQEIQNLVAAGKDFTLGSDTEAYTRKLNQLADLNNQSRIQIEKWNEKTDQAGKTANRTSKEVNNLSKATKKCASAASMASIGMDNFTKGIKKGIWTILKYGLGIRSMYFLFRKLRAAIAEGVKNFVLWEGENGRLNQSISNLQSSLATLKNSIGAAIVPLINAITPALVKIIDYVTIVTQKIAMLIALLTGNKTIMVADKVQKNYAASLDKTGKSAKKAAKELKGYLSPLDEINQYQSQKDEDSGAGGGGGIDTGSFHEVPVDPKLIQWLEDLKKKLQEVKDKLQPFFDAFKEGFKKGLGDDWKDKINRIKEGLKSIKDSLKEIWNDPEVSAARERYFLSLAEMLGAVVGTIFRIGLDIGVNLVEGIAQALEEKKDEIKEYLVDMFDIGTDLNKQIEEFVLAIGDIFDVLTGENAVNATAKLVEVFMEAFMLITENAAKLGLAIVTLITQPIIDNKEKIKQTLDDMFAILGEFFDFVQQAIKDVRDILKQVWNDHLDPMFKNLTEGLSNLLGIILDGWNNYISPVIHNIIDAVKELWDNYLKDIFDDVINIIGIVGNLISMLFKNIIVPWIGAIIDKYGPGVKLILDAIIGVIKILISIAGTCVEVVLKGIRSVLEFLETGFTEGWAKAWENAKKSAVDNWEALKDDIKGIINSILDFVEKFVNNVVDAINGIGGRLGEKLSNIEMPEWLGGGKLNIQIPELKKVSIPRLAQGAVIPPNKEFMAVLGDQKQGTNIETPLSTMIDAFRQVMRENNSGNGNKVVIQMVTPDKQKLAEYVVEGGKVLQMSTGNNIFELVGG